MNNKIITLGFVDFDWHFAKGKFSCNCINTIPTNAFDRVICGILSKKQLMSKDEIATIMGFNVIDNPKENLYCDCSEKAIFDNAISSLTKYGLIQNLLGLLGLTESGWKSLESRTKQCCEVADVELYIDEYIGTSFSCEMIKGLPISSVEYETHPDWDTLSENPMDALNAQKRYLINEKTGKDVTSINCLAIEYYVATVKIRICYNLESLSFIVSSAIGAQATDEVLQKNELLQRTILAKFFEGYKPSVIYKPTYQEQKEGYILNLVTEDINVNVITCMEDFMSNRNEKLHGDNVSILYFSIQKISDKIKTLLKGLRCDIICVEYVDGNFDNCQADSIIIENNICYYHVDKLRASDFCICKNTYYSFLPYILDFNGSSYNIPLIYEYQEKKYNFAILFAPFAEFIIRQAKRCASDVLTLLENPISSKGINKVLKIRADINYFNIDRNETISDEVKILDDLIQKSREKWNENIRTRLNNLKGEIEVESSDIILHDHLKNIERDIKSSSCDNDTLKLFDEVEAAIGKASHNGPHIETQCIYILDTCIFMDMPIIIKKFDIGRDKVVIPRMVEQELDGLTHDPNKEKNAREALLLIRWNQKWHPQFLKIKDNINKECLPRGFDPQKNDNDMLAAAIELETSDFIDRVFIVTNDTEFIDNINDCINSGAVSNRIEGINLNELLHRLGN